MIFLCKIYELLFSKNNKLLELKDKNKLIWNYIKELTKIIKLPLNNSVIDFSSKFDTKLWPVHTNITLNFKNL